MTVSHDQEPAVFTIELVPEMPGHIVINAIGYKGELVLPIYLEYIGKSPLEEKLRNEYAKYLVFVIEKNRNVEPDPDKFPFRIPYRSREEIQDKLANRSKAGS